MRRSRQNLSLIVFHAERVERRSHVSHLRVRHWVLLTLHYEKWHRAAVREVGRGGSEQVLSVRRRHTDIVGYVVDEGVDIWIGSKVSKVKWAGKTDADIDAVLTDRAGGRGKRGINSRRPSHRRRRPSRYNENRYARRAPQVSRHSFDPGIDQATPVLEVHRLAPGDIQWRERRIQRRPDPERSFPSWETSDSQI